MAKNDETAVVIASQYAVLQHSTEELQGIINSNIGAGNLGPADLERVKVPAGGGTTWEVATLDGIESTRNLDGVVVAWKDPRAYWESSYDDSGGGTPPDCSSEDGITGVGNPGGSCAECEFAQFGSAVDKEGNPAPGQACRQMRLMAIVCKDDLVPMLLIAPPTSMQNLRRYFLRLASRAVPYYGVVTRFTLSREKNKAGLEYSAINATTIERLTDDARAKMEGYAKVIGTSLERRSAHDAGDFS